MPPQTVRCHPHLVIGNGLDLSHFSSLHDLELVGAPRLEAATFTTSLELQAYPRSPTLRRALGAGRSPIQARFTASGGSLAIASFRSPLRFDALFTGRANAEGHCETQTLLFFYSSRPLYVWRSLLLVYTLLRNDRRMLDGLRFAPDWSESDESLRAFADMVDRLDTW